MYTILTYFIYDNSMMKYIACLSLLSLRPLGNPCTIEMVLSYLEIKILVKMGER